MSDNNERNEIHISASRRQGVIDLIALIHISVVLIEGNDFHKECFFKNRDKLLDELGILYHEFASARDEVT